MILSREKIRAIYDILCKYDENVPDKIMQIEPKFLINCHYKYGWVNKYYIYSFFDDCFIATVGDKLQYVNITSKSDPLWEKVPYLEETMLFADDYANIKRAIVNDFIIDHFDGYSEHIGPMSINKKIREKYKNYQQHNDDEIVRIDDALIVKSYYLTIMLNQFKYGRPYYAKDAQLVNRLGIAWPLCNQLATDDQRQLPDYPLMTTIDLLKMDYIASHIVSMRKRTIFVATLMESFYKYNKDDIKKWAKSKGV